MGNDGGSIPDRRDLVRSKPKAEQADKNNQTIAQWFFCALSKRPLQEPIVSCALGKLYNKDSIIEYLLDKSSYGDGEKICGHVRSLKDVKTLKLTPNPSKTPVDTDKEMSRPKAAFVCPLTLKEMSGSQPFVYLNTCGCVFSAAGLRAISADKEEQELCPQCGKKFDRSLDLRTINPGPEEAEKMREAMIAARAMSAGKTSKKRKAAEAVASGAATAEDSSDAKRSKHSPSVLPPPSTNTALSSVARKVADSLAEEEKKRKGNMSAAVASLYQPKDPSKRSKETFLTMNTFTRYA